MSLRRYAHLTLAGLALLAGLAVFYTAQLRFNYNFNDFYPAGDPDLDYYLGYAQRFGNDNDYLLVGLETPENQTVFAPAYLARLDSLTHAVRRLPHVRSAVSLTTVANPVFEGLGVFNLPYLHPAEASRRTADSALIYRTPGLVGNLLSPDACAATLVLQRSEERRVGKECW